jgi:hypothetical protein
MKNFPDSFYNLMSMIGAMIALASFGLILFMILLETMAESPKPYVGIIAFVILPAIMLVGVGIFVAGLVREGRRVRAGNPPGRRLPHIDLNDPRHRTAFAGFSIGTVLLLLFSAFGSFQAYEHTDSDQFCGETCHTVMEPEYTAYQFSPHARVGCVKCHIGPGTDWFVRSKLSGAYQVYATAFNKFPRPIPTPIEDLRPAQETCEQCHWPQHFFSEKRRTNSYFLPDEANTRWSLDLLMKIGGGNLEKGPTTGIHWHMNIANEVEYATLNSKRQIIPWVKVKSSTGVERTYRSIDLDIPPDSLEKSTKRRMDCIDCHNRPTHIYHQPARSVNQVMLQGGIDPGLPGMKALSVRVLENGYSTKSAGLDSIGLLVREYYAKEYSQIVQTRADQIEQAIGELKTIYSRNYFPEMKVDWRAFNDNIGHMYYPGCFRCHDGKHIADDGKVLSRDCNICHTIIAQGFPGEGKQFSSEGIEYTHPIDIGDAWKEMNCSDCHNPQ